jgi:hypothetical protein
METENTTSSRNMNGYTSEQSRKMLDNLRDLRNAQPAVQLNLANVAERLTVPRARTFANEGLGRRLPVIERAVINTYRIYPPDRKDFLTRDQCTDVAIQLHAFAINLYALFDNIAWVCLLEAGKKLPAMKVGVFKSECRPFLPTALQSYLAQASVQTWFHDYGKLYRDSTAHRIAPYLPTRVYSPAEGERWKELHANSMNELLGSSTAESGQRLHERLERHAQLEIEKESLGNNSLLIGLSLTGEDATAPVYLHPQLLCDLGLAHELILAFTTGIRQHYGWPEPSIPPMVVN